ncbi:MAG: hypothetical protein R2789_11295 [Microthrixaceae bacterium]
MIQGTLEVTLLHLVVGKVPGEDILDARIEGLERADCACTTRSISSGVTNRCAVA